MKTERQKGRDEAVNHIKKAMLKEVDYAGRIGFPIDSGFWALILKEAKEGK